MTNERKEAEWYFVKNWWKYQHYRDRNPPWIKLEKSILHSPAVQSLKIEDRWRLLILWLIASEHEGSLAVAKAELRRSLGVATHHQALNVLARIEATGLISQHDIRGDRPKRTSKVLELEEKRREEKRREEKKNPPNPPKGGQGELVFLLPDWIPRDAWQGFIEMRKTNHRRMTGRGMNLAIAKLEKLRAAGNDPVEVLNQSVMNGWQGLFEVKYGTSRDDQRRRKTVEGLSRFLEKHSEVAGDLRGDDGPSDQ